MNIQKVFWIAGGLALVAALLIFVVLRPTGGQERPAKIVECVNTVDAHPGPKDAWQPAVVDMNIFAGGQVRTGAASSARLQLLEGIVRLSADTVFTVKKCALQGQSPVTTLFLEEGRLWAHLTSDQSHDFSVETANAVVAVRDTRLSVRATDLETLVSVAQGKVALTAHEQSVTVAAGQQAVVALDRPLSLPQPMSDRERSLWATEGDVPELAPPTPTPTRIPGCVEPPAGLVSWWTGDGSAMDSQDGHHGRLENGAQFASGLVDRAFRFDGVDDWVLVPETANIDGLQQLTIETWVKLDALPPGRIERFVTLTGEKAVVRYDGLSGPRQLHFYMNIGNRLRHIRVDDVLQTGLFYHVVATYDGQTMRLYLDGAQVGRLTASGTVGAGMAVELSSDVEPLHGLLDEVGVYNRALSGEEILALYDAGNAGKCKP